MTSDKFMVNSDAGRMAAARYATENFAWRAKLSRRDMLRLDLLVEETLGMVKTTLDDFYGQLWFAENDGALEIHLEATADMDPGKKRELIGLSSTGANAAPRGFMARLGGSISDLLRGVGSSLDAYGQETIRYGIVHTPDMIAPGMDMIPIWTLQTCRADLKRADDDTRAAKALEDLERSIVASLADDIVVGVKGDRVDMVITKRF